VLRFRAKSAICGKISFLVDVSLYFFSLYYLLILSAETRYLVALAGLRSVIEKAPTMQPYVIFLTDGLAGDSNRRIEQKFSEIIRKYQNGWGGAGLRFTAIGFGSMAEMNRAQAMLQLMCSILPPPSSLSLKPTFLIFFFYFLFFIFCFVEIQTFPMGSLIKQT
jgi:hypothetical protein